MSAISSPSAIARTAYSGVSSIGALTSPLGPWIFSWTLASPPAASLAARFASRASAKVSSDHFCDSGTRSSALRAT